MTRLFLDTNIVVDLLDRREPFCQDAVRLFTMASQFKDFEDALQYYTALKAKADVIITRNGKDFTASKIPVMTATEYLATLE